MRKILSGMGYALLCLGAGLTAQTSVMQPVQLTGNSSLDAYREATEAQTVRAIEMQYERDGLIELLEGPQVAIGTVELTPQAPRPAPSPLMRTIPLVMREEDFHPQMLQSFKPGRKRHNRRAHRAQRNGWRC